MRMLFKTAAAAACLLVAPAAMAAPTITGVSVQGATSMFTWSTAPSASQDTLFIAHGAGAGVNQVVNPKNDFTPTKFGKADQFGDYNFTLYGDGFGALVQNAKGKVLSAPNSDLSYAITVMVKDGKKTGTLSGLFTPGTNAFVSTSGAFTGSSGSYQLDVFDWGRQLNDYVGKRSTSTTGDTGATLADYRGDLSLTSTAVPEPATWALMILGFGAVGGALRARRSRKPVAANA